MAAGEKNGHMYIIKCLLVHYLLRCTHRAVAPVSSAVRLIHVNMENRHKTGNDDEDDDDDVEVINRLH